MELHLDRQDGYVYDPVIKQYDTAFWMSTSGTPAISGTKLRFTSAAAASYIQHIFADIEFSLNVPTTPSAGEAKHWGLRSPASDLLGAIYFEIAGAVFTCVSKDKAGNTKTTTLTWSAYENADTKYRIMWGREHIVFLINGVVVATHTVAPDEALPLRIVNADADNTDLAFVKVSKAAAII